MVLKIYCWKKNQTSKEDKLSLKPMNTLSQKFVSNMVLLILNMLIISVVANINVMKKEIILMKMKKFIWTSKKKLSSFCNINLPQIFMPDNNWMLNTNIIYMKKVQL